MRGSQDGFAADAMGRGPGPTEVKSQEDRDAIAKANYSKGPAAAFYGIQSADNATNIDNKKD